MLSENRQKRQSDRANKALNKMLFNNLSKRSRVAKKQTTTALGPKNKISTYSGSEPDPQDKIGENMNLKDKIAETLLNSFNLMLNELSQEEIEKEKSSPQARAKRRIRRDRKEKDDIRSRSAVGAGSAQGDKRDRQVNLALRRGGKSGDKLPLFARGRYKGRG